MGAYHKDNAKLLHKRPPQSVLVMFVGRVSRGRLIISGAGRRCAFLLYEDVGYEIINDRRVHRRVIARPEDDPGCGEDLERVQHVDGIQRVGFISAKYLCSKQRRRRKRKRQKGKEEKKERKKQRWPRGVQDTDAGRKVKCAD